MASHSSILAWRIPVDRGDWQATVHGVEKSWSDMTELLNTAQHMGRVIECQNVYLFLLIICIDNIVLQISFHFFHFSWFNICLCTICTLGCCFCWYISSHLHPPYFVYLFPWLIYLSWFHQPATFLEEHLDCWIQLYNIYLYLFFKIYFHLWHRLWFSFLILSVWFWNKFFPSFPIFWSNLIDKRISGSLKSWKLTLKPCKLKALF